MLEIFTIVLNGMPFIKEHLPIFNRLNIPWRWHIVEGVALPEKCTGWCQPVLPTDHNNWRSNDGTTEYLDSIKGDNVIVYRTDGPWHGKLDMCNAPLANIAPGAVLHELDVDEFWSHTQLETVHNLFTNYGAGKGWYYSDCYYGPDIHVVNTESYGDSIGHSWIRTHRYIGLPWQAHEPPSIPYEGRVLSRPEMASHGLIFAHFGYALEEQARFKENYYRQANNLFYWQRLQANTQWPIQLDRCFPYWPGQHATLNKTEDYRAVIKRLQTT